MITSMVDVYYELVKAGMRSIESVPEQNGIRAAVQVKLNSESEGTAP